MPDSKGNQKGDPPDTSLHAYKDGKADQVEGDPTGEAVREAPVEQRDDPGKHTPNRA